MFNFPGRSYTLMLIGVFLMACSTSLAMAQPSEEIKKLPDNKGTGKYPALKEEVDSLPDHVIYRPQKLVEMGDEKLGLVAWGNGACSDDGASTRFHLLELASHGYLVIASGRIYSGPGAHPAEPREPVEEGRLPPPRTQASDLISAIDWALAENSREGSPYYGRIDEDQIAASGFSCGGLQALQIANDPRIDTLVLQNTGIFKDGPGPIPGLSLTKADLEQIHTPTLYILGGESDIAYENGMDDFHQIEHVPVAVANLPVGHGGTYHEPEGGEAAQVAVKWLQWQLRGDQEAAKWFAGEECLLCTDDEWSLDRKGF